MSEQPLSRGAAEQPTLSPRDALRFILMRYDTDAGMAPGVWEVCKSLQAHLSWLQHINRARARDRAVTHIRQQGGTVSHSHANGE
jgi:hypothetical protein